MCGRTCMYTCVITRDNKGQLEVGGTLITKYHFVCSLTMNEQKGTTRFIAFWCENDWHPTMTRAAPCIKYWKFVSQVQIKTQVLSTGEWKWRYNNDLGNSVGRLTFNSSSFSLLTSTSCFFSCLTRLRHSSSLCAFVCVWECVCMGESVCMWECVCVCVLCECERWVVVLVSVRVRMNDWLHFSVDS